jgi:hypothetical protein
MDSPSKASAKVPACFHHQASGQAVVKLGGRFVYLGAFGSQAAEQAYQRVVAEWQVRGGLGSAPQITVDHVTAGYWRHAEGYYRKNGKPIWQQLVDRHCITAHYESVKRFILD